MRLTLSSAAAPDASLEELLAACGRRGFAALELEEGHEHGLSPSLPGAEAAAAAALAAGRGIALAAFRLADPGRAAHPDVAALAAALGAPIVVRVPAAEAAALVRAAGPGFARAGATLLLAGGDPSELERLRRLAGTGPAGAVGLAWDVEPAARPVSRPEAALEAGAGLLRHIRLRGGGPESAAQAGLGIGALVRALALEGYAGTFALAPSTPSYHYAWGAWLGRKGGWGCGSKAGERTLVGIGGSQREREGP